MITVVSASMPKGCFFFDVPHTNRDQGWVLSCRHHDFPTGHTAGHRQTARAPCLRSVGGACYYIGNWVEVGCAV